MSRKKGPLKKNIGRRAFTAFVICVIGYSFLIYRLVDIQILKSEDYKKRVENQSTEKINLNSGRGIIYDRNNKPLTDNKKKQIILVSKEKLNNDPSVLGLIKEVTDMSEVEIYKIIEEQASSSIVEIESKYLDKNSKDKLEEKDIIVEEKTLRYSGEGILSHTIGHLKKADNSGELGIEKSKDDILKDSNGKYISAFRAGDSGNTENVDILKGSINTVDESEEDRHIRLTIDYDIQKIVEDIVNKEENPTAVVISDIETGELLSMCSRPNFDQNDIAKYSLEREENNGELINRVTKSTYPPASVFKLVVLYAALENNAVGDDYSYNCSGKVSVGSGDEVLKCHKAEGHGIENLQQALSNSCNTAFFDIASKVGEEAIIEGAKALHLDEKVDIGIEESSREIPSDVALRNLAIGQGSLGFTPIQINQMTQIIANNGTYKPLYLYDSIIDNNKNIVKPFKTSKQEEIVSPYSITIVKEMMKDVSKEGTAKELSDLEGRCGVKTGTAQAKLNKKDITHGWITGFYPEDNPKYAITVLIEGTEESSKSAVPMFKEICEGINKKY